METEEELWLNYKNESRYDIRDRYEIAIIDPSRNGYLVGFWSGRFSVPKRSWGFCTSAHFADEYEEEVDWHLKKDKNLKSFLKKNKYKAVRVKLEKTILFNEM